MALEARARRSFLSHFVRPSKALMQTWFLDKTDLIESSCTEPKRKRVELYQSFTRGESACLQELIAVIVVGRIWTWERWNNASAAFLLTEILDEDAMEDKTKRPPFSTIAMGLWCPFVKFASPRAICRWMGGWEHSHSLHLIDFPFFFFLKRKEKAYSKSFVRRPMPNNVYDYWHLHLYLHDHIWMCSSWSFGLRSQGYQFPYHALFD